jgi:hypothetical protein
VGDRRNRCVSAGSFRPPLAEPGVRLSLRTGLSIDVVATAGVFCQARRKGQTRFGFCLGTLGLEDPPSRFERFETRADGDSSLRRASRVRTPTSKPVATTDAATTTPSDIIQRAI